MFLHFAVGVGGGKGSVCPRITHLISQKVDVCIYGGNFVSSWSRDYSIMGHSYKYRYSS